jgi:NADH dehydrogenase FAD-containing subunit
MADSNLTLIVGGGFVGLFTALHLRHRDYPHPIVLLDPQSQFVFKPLLYESLSAEMSQEQVFPSYEELLQDSDINFVRDSATQIDLRNRRVETAGGRSYDYQNLVLAVGGAQGYLDTEDAQANSFAFRTQADVERLQQHLRDCLHRASQTTDPIERQKLLTVAIVGAGPSGVEITATLADLLPQWYDRLDGNLHELRLVLINHGQEILAGDVNSHLQDKALAELQQRSMKVELLLGMGVKSVTPQALTYQAGDNPELQMLNTATTIWMAGTTTNPLLKQLELPDDSSDRHGLPLVTPTLQLADFPEVFAAGDCAVVAQKSLPPIAQVAYQQGAGIANNLIALSQGRAPEPVQVNLRGTLMKLGIGNGVANLFDRVQIDGKAGDLIRNATYLEMLPTPVHNFKATVEWINESLFYPDRLTSIPDPQKIATAASRRAAVAWIGGGLAIAGVIIGAIFLAQRSPQWKQAPTHSHQQQLSSQNY